MVDYSNPIRVEQLEDALTMLRYKGVKEVHVELIDIDSIRFTSVEDPKEYALCYSNNLEVYPDKSDRNEE